MLNESSEGRKWDVSLVEYYEWEGEEDHEWHWR